MRTTRSFFRGVAIPRRVFRTGHPSRNRPRRVTGMSACPTDPETAFPRRTSIALGVVVPHTVDESSYPRHSLPELPTRCCVDAACTGTASTGSIDCGPNGITTGVISSACRVNAIDTIATEIRVKIDRFICRLSLKCLFVPCYCSSGPRAVSLYFWLVQAQQVIAGCDLRSQVIAIVIGYAVSSLSLPRIHPGPPATSRLEIPRPLVGPQ